MHFESRSVSPKSQTLISVHPHFISYPIETFYIHLRRIHRSCHHLKLPWTMSKPLNKKKPKIPEDKSPPQNEIGGTFWWWFTNSSLLYMCYWIFGYRVFSSDKYPPVISYVGTSLTDLRLPLWLFATDIIPTMRLNIYSSPDLLPFIRNVLRRTREFETIRQSCFGKLFDLPVRQCPVSCMLIHSFLTRQLVCLPKNTLWPVLGGLPFRYGLEEFGTVTGLPCGSFPEGYHPDTAKKIVAGRDSVWKSLFGKKEMVTVAQLCRMLENDTNMSGWKKIHIALIIIVDGVLIAHKQKPRPTPRYVRLVENLQKKFPFPWGTESFLKTISCMKPPKFVPIKCEDPVATLVRKLKQFSFRLQGFPLLLQLVAFHAIPQLMDYIPAPSNSLTVMDLEDGLLPAIYHNTPQSLPSTSDAWNLPPM